MNKPTIIGLALSAGVMALGIALSDAASPSVIGTPLVMLGGAGAAVCITLWSARAMRFGRYAMGGRGAAARVRRDSARVQSLIAQLTDFARQAETRGVLTLAECSISERRSLFAEGVEMLVAAEPVHTIRAKLGTNAEIETAAAHASRQRMIAICRLLPLIALSMALAMMIWMLAVIGKPAQLGSLTPLGLIVAVYGAFAVAAVSAEVGDRAVSATAEDELAGILVIETIAAIRDGESAERVEAILQGLTPPPRSEAAPTGLRRAA